MLEKQLSASNAMKMGARVQGRVSLPVLAAYSRGGLNIMTGTDPNTRLAVTDDEIAAEHPVAELLSQSVLLPGTLPNESINVVPLLRSLSERGFFEIHTEKAQEAFKKLPNGILKNRNQIDAGNLFEVNGERHVLCIGELKGLETTVHGAHMQCAYYAACPASWLRTLGVPAWRIVIPHWEFNGFDWGFGCVRVLEPNTPIFVRESRTLTSERDAAEICARLRRGFHVGQYMAHLAHLAMGQSKSSLGGWSIAEGIEDVDADIDAEDGDAGSDATHGDTKDLHSKISETAGLNEARSKVPLPSGEGRQRPFVLDAVQSCQATNPDCVVRDVDNPKWHCADCTFANPPAYVGCQVCRAKRCADSDATLALVRQREAESVENLDKRVSSEFDRRGREENTTKKISCEASNHQTNLHRLRQERQERSDNHRSRREMENLQAVVDTESLPQGMKDVAEAALRAAKQRQRSDVDQASGKATVLNASDHSDQEDHKDIDDDTSNVPGADGGHDGDNVAASQLCGRRLATDHQQAEAKQKGAPASVNDVGKVEDRHPVRTPSVPFFYFLKPLTADAIGRGFGMFSKDGHDPEAGFQNYNLVMSRVCEHKELNRFVAKPLGIRTACRQMHVSAMVFHHLESYGFQLGPPHPRSDRGNFNNFTAKLQEFVKLLKEVNVVFGDLYPSNIACRDNQMWSRMLDFWSAHYTSEGWVTFLRGASYELEQSLKLDGDLSVRVIDWDTAHLGEMGNFVENAQVGFRVRFKFAQHDAQFVQALLKLDENDARWGKLSSGVKALIDEAFSEVIGAHVGTKRLQDFQGC